MPSIIAPSGPLILDRLYGAAAPSGDTLSTINRVGVDGITLRLQAKKPGSATWESMTAVTTKAKAQSTFQTYKTLQGQLVSLVDDLGNQWDNVAVIRVEQTQAKAIGKSTGFAVANPVAILRCTWQLQFTEVSA